ncbi:MAG: DUF1080 domain-containing protein [Rhodothermales bacterium]
MIQKTIYSIFVLLLFTSVPALGQLQLTEHPNAMLDGWVDLFSPDLSNAIYPEGIWTVEGDVLTASEDETIWSSMVYDDFVLDLEFKTADGTNSGVIIHGTDMINWIPNSVEIQIADDHNKKWADSPKNWQCAAVFGRKAASKSVVKKPGEWNKMSIKAVGQHISVVLNGEPVINISMADYTSVKDNPDGSEVPDWLSKPMASLPTYGHIGLQGKHGDATIWFRNVRVKVL